MRALVEWSFARRMFRQRLHSYAIELRIRPGGWVVERLQVGKNRHARNRRANIGLDPLEQLVAALHGPVAGHQHVHRHKAARSRLARAQRMEGDPFWSIVLLNLPHSLLL